MKDTAPDIAKICFEVLRSQNLLMYSGKENKHTFF